MVSAVRDAVQEHTSGKTVLGVLMGTNEDTEELTSSTAKVPVYSYPESAARALATAVQYQEWRSKELGGRMFENRRNRYRTIVKA